MKFSFRKSPDADYFFSRAPKTWNNFGYYSKYSVWDNRTDEKIGELYLHKSDDIEGVFENIGELSCSRISSLDFFVNMTKKQRSELAKALNMLNGSESQKSLYDIEEVRVSLCREFLENDYRFKTNARRKEVCLKTEHYIMQEVADQFRTTILSIGFNETFCKLVYRVQSCAELQDLLELSKDTNTIENLLNETIKEEQSKPIVEKLISLFQEEVRDDLKISINEWINFAENYIFIEKVQQWLDTINDITIVRCLIRKVKWYIGISTSSSNYWYKYWE